MTGSTYRIKQLQQQLEDENKRHRNLVDQLKRDIQQAKDREQRAKDLECERKEREKSCEYQQRKERWEVTSKKFDEVFEQWRNVN